MVTQHGDPGRERFLMLVRESPPPILELIGDENLPGRTRGYTAERLYRQQVTREQPLEIPPQVDASGDVRTR